MSRPANSPRKLLPPPRTITPEDIERAHRESREWAAAFRSLRRSMERITGADLAVRVR